MLNERAMKKLQGRKTKPATYTLDLNLIGDYWGWFGKRSYHHTGKPPADTAVMPSSPCNASLHLKPACCMNDKFGTLISQFGI